MMTAGLKWEVMTAGLKWEVWPRTQATEDWRRGWRPHPHQGGPRRPRGSLGASVLPQRLDLPHPKGQAVVATREGRRPWSLPSGVTGQEGL